MKIRTIRRSAAVAVVAVAITCIPALPAAAQQANDPTLVDKVVAVVGDSVILASQVQEARQTLQLQGQNVPSGGPALQQFDRHILDQLIDNALVLQAAAKDTLVKVDEADVDKTVNDEIQRRSQQFSGGGPAFQQALLKQGFTLAEYRDYLKSQVRQQQVRTAYMQMQIRKAPQVEVSEDELHSAFDSLKDQIGQRPREIRIAQVVVAPRPSDSAWAVAKAKAQAILDSIRAGGDFAALAKKYSEDPGSATQGGELGWFRRGHMIKPIEDAAFNMYVGSVSGLVKSDFGYHIVKLERARPGEREAAHILIRPKMTDSDVSAARLRADSVADMARAGDSIETLYDRYSDPEVRDTITVPFNQLNQQLPPSYGPALQTASTGQVLGPLEYTTAQGEKRFAVVQVREILAAGAYTFDDVKAQLAEQVRQNKQIDKILDDLRQRTHIDIRM